MKRRSAGIPPLPSHFPVVHLAIDLDEDNISCIPDADSFVEKERKFADTLRKHNIPTICVTFPKGQTSFHLVPGKPGDTTVRPEKVLQSHGLQKFRVRADEDILVKGRENAFSGAVLTARLLGLRTKKVILTGGVTGVCIAATAAGATSSGFEVLAACDLMYSPTASKPEEHQQQLQKALSAQGTQIKKKITLTNQSQILNQVAPKKSKAPTLA